MPARCGVGQVDRNLGILDPPSGAGVLALHAYRSIALLQMLGRGWIVPLTADSRQVSAAWLTKALFLGQAHGT